MGNGTFTRDLGLLALRTAVGGTLAYHGAQKLFGWFGGGGPEGTGGYFDSMGFKPGKANAVLAGLGEFGGGVGLALGAATPAAAAGAVGAMTVAVSVHAPNGFAAQGGGFEYPLVLGAASTALALAGPGGFSVDRVLGYRLNGPLLAAAALTGAAVGGAVTIARRTAALQAAAVDAEIEQESAEGDPILGDYDPETGGHDEAHHDIR
jgi:putative oxidoreductase